MISYQNCKTRSLTTILLHPFWSSKIQSLKTRFFSILYKCFIDPVCLFCFLGGSSFSGLIIAFIVLSSLVVIILLLLGIFFIRKKKLVYISKTAVNQVVPELHMQKIGELQIVTNYFTVFQIFWEKCEINFFTRLYLVICSIALVKRFSTICILCPCLILSIFTKENTNNTRIRCKYEWITGLSVLQFFIGNWTEWNAVWSEIIRVIS